MIQPLRTDQRSAAVHALAINPLPLGRQGQAGFTAVGCRDLADLTVIDARASSDRGTQTASAATDQVKFYFNIHGCALVESKYIL